MQTFSPGAGVFVLCLRLWWSVWVGLNTPHCQYLQRASTMSLGEASIISEIRLPWNNQNSLYTCGALVASICTRIHAPPFPKQWSAVQRPEAWPSVEVIGECDDIERAEQLVACALLDSDSPQVVDVLRVSKQAETPSCRTGGHRVFRQS